MKRSILIIALALTACATPSELRKTPAVLDVSSNKPAKQVAICISEGWENAVPTGALTPMPINTSLKANGYSIIGKSRSLLGGQGTVILADIADTTSGSTTRYYKNGWPGFGSHDVIVTSCQ